MHCLSCPDNAPGKRSQSYRIRDYSCCHLSKKILRVRQDISAEHTALEDAGGNIRCKQNNVTLCCRHEGEFFRTDEQTLSRMQNDILYVHLTCKNIYQSGDIFCRSDRKRQRGVRFQSCILNPYAAANNQGRIVRASNITPLVQTECGIKIVKLHTWF